MRFCAGFLSLGVVLTTIGCPERPQTCTYGGKTYNVGDSFDKEGCGTCVCNGGGVLSCSSSGCDGGVDGGVVEDVRRADRWRDDVTPADLVGVDSVGWDTAMPDSHGPDAGPDLDAFILDYGPATNEIVALPATACEIVTINGQPSTANPAPGDNVVVTASAYPAPTGGASVNAVDWTLVRAPAGSRTALRVSSGMRTSVGQKATGSQGLDPSRGMDLAGWYVLRARVSDDQGGQADHDCYLSVRPQAALYIELSWDRAEDNLDLRLAKQQDDDSYCAVGVTPQVLTGLAQPCQDAATTCYFGNCLASLRDRPDWDQNQLPGTNGDPLLVSDYQTGFGPEVIQIPQPVAGKYLISGHFWNGGRGRTTAYMAVWVHGQLWGQLSRKLSLQDWWEPFVVEWPAQATDPLCLKVPGGAELCHTAPICTPIESCAQCSDSSDCGPGTSCAPALQQCTPQEEWCLSDVYCGPLACAEATDVCVEADCDETTACEDSELECDLGTHICVPKIVQCEETNEPNNTIATALTYTAPRLNDLLCRGDVDMVKISGSAGSELRVQVTFDVGSGSGSPNLSATLLDASGTEIESVSVGRFDGIARLSTQVAAAADFYLLLDGNFATLAQYSYSVVVSECLAEEGEPNETYEQAGSVPLAAGTHQRTLCGEQDVDHFQIVAAKEQRTRVVVGYNVNNGDINAALLTTSGAVIRSSDNWQGDELLHYDALGAAETILLRVNRTFHQGDVEVQDYTVTITHEDLPDCDDGHEPNGSRATASPVAPGTYSVTICDGLDLDFYAIDLSGGGAVYATIRFVHSEGDLDFELQYEDGNRVDSSTSTQNEERVEGTNLSPGWYYLYVYPFNGSSAPTDPQGYSLEVSYTTTTGDAGVEDAAAAADAGFDDLATAEDSAVEDL